MILFQLLGSSHGYLDGVVSSQRTEPSIPRNLAELLNGHGSWQLETRVGTKVLGDSTLDGHQNSADRRIEFLLEGKHLAELPISRTRNGYIGHARPGIQKGDVVYALAGCKVPVVLRRNSGEGYFLVSYACVVGFIHGEMWDLVATRQTEMQDFVID